MNVDYSVELSEKEYDALKTAAEALRQFADLKDDADGTMLKDVQAKLKAVASTVTATANDAAELDPRQLGVSKGPGPTNPNGGQEGDLVANNTDNRTGVGGTACTGYTVNININLPKA